MILGDAFSAHIIKWANGLYDKGVELLIFSLSDYNGAEFRSGIKIESFKVPDAIKLRKDGNLLKSIYFFAIPKIKKVIRSYKPDILHAHSASSYGLVGCLTGFHPLYISVWGNDVYNYPQKFIGFRELLKFTLARTDRIFSTSHIMARETAKYTDKNITVIPFGIDTTKFNPSPEKKGDEIVIGTIKTLDYKYGSIELFTAFKMLKEKHPQLPLKLVMVGAGPLEAKMRSMVSEAGLDESVLITGFIKYSEVPRYHNMLDIYVALSTEDSETFGVAILEASACEKPVIVSNKGGLPEVVEHNVSGLIIPPDAAILAENLEKLVFDPELRKRLGKGGRQRVIDKFDLNSNLETMIKNYHN
jgi:glycosyltransferase involved in cell wall biosynthesis